MTIAENLAIKKNRIATLEGRGIKNIKAPGTLKKLKRQVRNLEKEN